MMEPSEDRERDDPAGPLNRPAYGGVLVQGRVRPDLVVVGAIGFEDPAQMTLTEYDHVIEALPSDRADKPLRIRILPGRPWPLPGV